MGTRWRGWLAAVAATGLACALIALDVVDSGIRRWWATHAFTTDAIAGLAVLLITVLVADQVVRLRQINNRSVATAAQAAILMAQAGRSSRAVSAVRMSTVGRLIRTPATRREPCAPDYNQRDGRYAR
jgi:Na+/H+-dicarboxylate symporter